MDFFDVSIFISIYYPYFRLFGSGFISIFAVFNCLY